MKMTVKGKLLTGLSIIFSISILLLTTLISNTFENDMKKNIKKDMENTYVNAVEYVKQLFIVNNLEYTDKAFVQNGSIIVGGLGKSSNCFTTIYSTAGKSPYQYIPAGSRIPWNKEDKKNEQLIQQAANNKAVIKISMVEGKAGKQYIVDFVFPLYLNDRYLGIVQFASDYTDLYHAKMMLMRILMIFVIAIFLSLFILSYFLADRITKPLTKLSKAFYNVAEGNYGNRIERESNDEIGNLTDSFNYMNNKIKEQLEQIEEEKRKVMELQKVRTEFFNNVTHELKTPLTTISGYAQLLEGEVEDRNFYNRAVTRIQAEANRLHKMVVDLIEISKYSNKVDREYESVNLSELANSIAKDMVFKAERYNTQIIFEKENTFVHGDIEKLSEVIINLLDNAIKYSYDNSDIFLRVYNEDRFGVLQVENKSESISEELLDKVFEPHFRASHTNCNEKGSIGLGLYISRNIVEQHGGTIEIFNCSNNMISAVMKLPRERTVL